jgi:hypothetical protein
MGTDKNSVKINVRLAPAFHTYLTFTLAHGAEREKKPEYRGPRTTNELIVEILYEGNQEYKIPQTTDGL